MQGRDYSVASDFLKRLFGETLHEVELRACPNIKGEPGAASLKTRDPDTVERFCARRDQDGIGIYFGVATRGDGEKNDKSNVVEVPALWVDIDCAKQGIAGQDALDALAYLPHPPSVIVNSGGGLHAYWVLEEPVSVAGGAYGPIEELLRKLALILAGDTQCAEVARIMRVPGTMNSKDATRALNDGEPALCEVVLDNGRVHDLGALAEWVDEQRSVLHAKRAVVRPVPADTDPFMRYAREAGYEPAIDIDAELAGIVPSDDKHGIHPTQLRVSMSMIARGHSDEEIVDLLLRETARHEPRDGKGWNWTAEEKAIRSMIRSGREKMQRREPEATARTSVPLRTDGNAALKLVHSAEPDAEKTRKAKQGREVGTSTTVAIGQSVVDVWQERHGPVIHANGSTYVYELGIWTEWNEKLAQRLRSIIQEACASLRVEPKTALLGAAKAYFMDRPELTRHGVTFDSVHILVAADACLDLTTYEIVPHSPNFYATRKVSATLEGSRECSTLIEFMRSAFADQSADQDAIISTLQEHFGAGIMPLHVKTRGQRKGALIFGPSGTGKTQVSELKRYLHGHEHVSGMRMADLLDRFGREGLIGKRAWIADDAIGEGETLDAETYKVVVTGEPTAARQKGGRNWEGRFGIDVVLTANNRPRVKDQSEATFNRTLVFAMTNVRPKGSPEPAGYTSVSEKIGKEELTGLLWWAIEGWKRLQARGEFAEPACMKQAVKSFQDDNNPIGEWMLRCVDKNPLYRVARADLMASFQGYRLLEHDQDREWRPHTVTRRVREALVGHDEPTVNGIRYMAGIALNEEGLAAWTRWKNSRYGENIGTVSEENEVNKLHQPDAPMARSGPKRTVF